MGVYWRGGKLLWHIKEPGTSVHLSAALPHMLEFSAQRDVVFYSNCKDGMSSAMMLCTGMRLKLPFLDTYTPIQVTLQTDKVTDIPCGTKGVMVYFDKVEVSHC